jgi:hypothetical protein
MTSLAALFVAAMPLLGAPGDDAKAKAGAQQTPKEQFQAVLDEYQKAQQTFSQAYSKAQTDTERSKIVDELYPKPAEYSARFLAIAEAAPDDPAAAEALVWCVQLGSGSGASKALRRLAEKHAENPKLASALPRLAYDHSPDAERLLRAVIDKNRDRTARGNATMALAQFLNQKIASIRSLNESDQTARQLEQFLTTQGYDKDAITRLKTADTGVLLKEVESLLEKVQKEFGDINSGRSTLGKTAANELNEIRNLGVGKTCPDIKGEDIDGKSFQLSDYRGKVVVVDFWGDW